MSLQVQWTTQFKKDYKLAAKRGRNMEALDNVIRMIANETALPKSIMTMLCPAISRGFVNVISNRIGCLFTRWKRTC